MDLDAIVIGNSAGGATAAAELMRAGMRVLRVERVAFDARSVYVDGVRTTVADGDAPLHGTTLLRPGPSEFAPGRYHGDRLPRHLWEWPIDYDAMRPYFDRAEDVCGVAGDATAPMPHLGQRQRPYAQPPEALETSAWKWMHAWRSHGLSPFQMPIATADPRDDDSCARLRCEAERFEIEAGQVRGVWLRDPATDRRELLRAGTYVLAAGAIGTPVLLLRSGLEGRSNQVGRNHMSHREARAIGIFARPPEQARTLRQIGWSDFQLGTPGFPHRLGIARVVPIDATRPFREAVQIPLPASLAQTLAARAVQIAASIEDLPHPRNRVSLGSGNTVRLERRLHVWDLARAKRMVRELRGALRDAGASICFGQVAADAVAQVTHHVGTARFGRDPLTSVVDTQCRVHGQEDVYVVDGSIFPTALGVGPALTVVANALRVADHIVKERARGAAS